MFDASLSDEERQMKIEKMADNEVMKVQEMNRLEQEEKSPLCESPFIKI